MYFNFQPVSDFMKRTVSMSLVSHNIRVNVEKEAVSPWRGHFKLNLNDVGWATTSSNRGGASPSAGVNGSSCTVDR